MIAISGADIITSLGAGREANFTAMCDGRVGSRRFAHFDPARFTIKHCYEIADRTTDRDIPGRASAWLGRVVGGAAREAGLDLQDRRVAVLVGTGLRELRGVELWHEHGAEVSVRDLHFASVLRDRLGVRGAIITLANACAASSFALASAIDMVELDEADAVVVAGCDSITESMLGIADRFNTVAPERIEPFDRDRVNVVLGEGAAAIVVEPAERLAARGGRPLGWVRSVGQSCDARHETAPDLDGVVAAMLDAHRRGGVLPGEIDLVIAHGTGTALNDPTEARAITEVFGDAARRPVIVGLKGMTGHTAGTSGLIGVIAALEAMRTGLVPPTAGLRHPIPEAAELRISGSRLAGVDVRLAQIDAFGFGGINAVAIVERP